MNSLNIEHLYLHVPFCLHLCNYCDFYKQKWSDGSQVDGFNQLLTASFNFYLNEIKKKNCNLNSPKTIYLGGGTPSLWGKSGAYFLKELFHNNNISLDKIEEFSMEVDPLAWSIETLEAWTDIGVNRWSVGVQSLNDDVLCVLDRVHRRSDVIKLLEYLQQKNQKFSVDLMIGIPKLGEVERFIDQEIADLMDFGPNHVSVYILEARKHYVNYKKIPNDEIVGVEYEMVCNTMKGFGFQHYEVSNFAKPNCESKHNIAYWNYKTVLGLGPSASSLLVLDDEVIRHKWKPNKPEYITEILSPIEVKIEKLFVQTRTAKGICLPEFFSGENLSKVTSLKSEWIGQGYAFNCETLSLTEQGMLLQDFFISQLLRYL